VSYEANQVGEPNWKNVDANIYNIASGSSAPDPSNLEVIPGMRVFGFKDGSAMNEIFATIELPHDLIPGTAIRPHIHWCPADSAAGDVKWQLCYTFADDGLPFHDAVTLTAVQAANGLNTYSSKEFAPIIPGTNLGGGVLVAMKLFRDATDPEDTYSGIAKLLSLGIHYQSKDVGSTGVFVST
jgi:hypothetical protein